MAIIGLQGTWNVTVAAKHAAWAQRFSIAGSDNGVDGTYVGSTTTPDVLVDGDQWGLNIQNNPTGPESWRPSRTRFDNFRVDGSFFRVDVQSDDGGGGGDEDFNDLILTLSKPLAEGEWIVYGTAKTYQGDCGASPCFPPPYIAIDTAAQLTKLLENAEIRPVLERVYGKDVANLAKREHFTPMLLPRSGAAPAGFLVKGGAAMARPTEMAAVKETMPKKLVDNTERGVSVAKAMTSASGYTATMTAAEVMAFDRFERIRPCETAALARAMLRFVEYDRTAEELGGAGYLGFGDREILGLTVTDEEGHYLFSFTRTVEQIAGEGADAPAGSDDPSQARPDLIIQFVDDPEGVAVHETAPYYNIANVRRINLCIYAPKLIPKVCRGDRVIQYLGDIPIVNNPGSQLHTDGTVTNNPTLSESGPAVERGAWNGSLDISGCFEGSSVPVAHYTVEYKVDDGEWTYLTVPAEGLHVLTEAIWETKSYGPDDVELSIGTRPAYKNIEPEKDEWALEVQYRKVRVNLASLLPADPEHRIADVQFRIRGYDEDGQYVPGTYDRIKLRVDTVPAVGDIASITVPGGEDPGECGMLVLPSDTTPLVARLRALDPAGFLRDWSLQAVRGSNTAVGLTDASTTNPPAGEFPGSDLNHDRYYGTSERPTADADGYIALNILPSVGWLEGRDFCGYSFELRVRDRTTDGKTTPVHRKVWDEVLGLSASAD